MHLENMNISGTKDCDEEVEVLTRSAKITMSKLYDTAEKIENSKSHVSFLKTCISEKIVPKGFKINEKRFNLKKDDLEEVSARLMVLELKENESKLEKYEKCFNTLKFSLKSKTSSAAFVNISRKLNYSLKRREEENSRKKSRKFEKLIIDKKPILQPEDLVREFFENIKEKKKIRRRHKLSKTALKKKRKEKVKKWKSKQLKGKHED